MVTPKTLYWSQPHRVPPAVFLPPGGLTWKGLAPMCPQSITTSVEWRPVVGFEGLYEVSADGQIASLSSRLGKSAVPRRLRLRPAVKPAGYLAVSLSRAHVARQYTVHFLVAHAFLGPRPSPRHVVCHGDGDPTNNRLENLRWDTWEGNEADKRRHGRGIVGERNHLAKATEAEVYAIREQHAAGETITALGVIFHLHPSTISDIVRGRIWAHVGGPIRPTRKTGRYRP